MSKNQSKPIIFFGDVQEYLSVIAKNHDDSAQLIDRSNYEQYLLGSVPGKTFYTSLGDLPKDLGVAYRLLSTAHTVFYCPPAQWSDLLVADICNPCDSIQGLTETLLWMLDDSVCVKNLTCSILDPISLVDQRRGAGPQLWIAGCSISHGVGVDTAQRYGQLLADQLNLPCSFLTRSGSAIDWAADQILRSDIQAGDTVLWGLTEPARLTYVDNNTLLSGVNIASYEMYPGYKKIVDLKNLCSHNTAYQHFYAIQQVINFCNKIKAKLYLVGLLLGSYSYLGFLKTQKNYIHIPYNLHFDNFKLLTSFKDLGSDSLHPGILQHKHYKEVILNHLTQQTTDTV
jgi:hypothetical protein